MFLKKSNPQRVKYFISIGAGCNQIQLIKKVKKFNFHIIAVDNNPVAPGFLYSDLKIQESIENYNEIYTKLRELLIDGEIVGILSKSYGNAIKTTAYLCEKFSIPFIEFKSCDNFINKKKMKSLFKRNRILSPEAYSFNSKSRFDKLDKDIFPLIGKPQIGHAKTDVRMIKNKQELKRFISKTDSNSPLLFEKYIEGEEIIVFGIVKNRKFYLVNITDKIKTEKPFFVDLMHQSPSKYNFLSGEIIKICQVISDSYNITSSPLIIEIIVTDKKDLFVIEAVPEFGGEFISDVLIKESTGYDFISEIIKLNSKRTFRIPSLKKKKNSVVIKFITGKKGKLISLTPQKSKKIKGIIFIKIFKEIGADIVEPETNHDRIGVVIAKGKTIFEAIKTADFAIEKLNITIQDK